MKITLKILSTALITLLISCGGKEEKKKSGFSYENKTTTETKTVPEAKETPASKTIDLTNKGIGPVTEITIDAEIDQELAAQGAKVYNSVCTACHRTDKNFIGPAPKDILERRTPEWVMNFIINPEKMTKEDPLAKALLLEYNGTPMPNQNITENDARAILEYFRTL